MSTFPYGDWVYDEAIGKQVVAAHTAIRELLDSLNAALISHSNSPRYMDWEEHLLRIAHDAGTLSAIETDLQCFADEANREYPEACG